MSELIKRYNKIKEYRKSPMYQPEIDGEYPSENGESVVPEMETPVCDGNAEEMGPTEIFFDKDSFVENFFLKYEKVADERLVALKSHLINVIGDVQYIIESEQTNEQWALDYMDALNEISGKF